MSKKILNSIKKRRIELGLRQFEFAKKLGISSAYLSCLESGKKRPSKLMQNKIDHYSSDFVASDIYDQLNMPKMEKRKEDEIREIGELLCDFTKQDLKRIKGIVGILAEI